MGNTESQYQCSIIEPDKKNLVFEKINFHDGQYYVYFRCKNNYRYKLLRLDQKFLLP